MSTIRQVMCYETTDGTLHEDQNVAVSVQLRLDLLDRWHKESGTEEFDNVIIDYLVDNVNAIKQYCKG